MKNLNNCADDTIECVESVPFKDLPDIIFNMEAFRSSMEPIMRSLSGYLVSLDELEPDDEWTETHKKNEAILEEALERLRVEQLEIDARIAEIMAMPYEENEEVVTLGDSEYQCDDLMGG